MCPDIQKHSKKNVRILFIVKSEFPGDNAVTVHCAAQFGNRNFQKKMKQNISTEWMPHSVQTALSNITP